MGRGGQDVPARKSEVTSDEEKRAALRIVGHFLSRSVVGVTKNIFTQNQTIYYSYIASTCIILYSNTIQNKFKS